MTIQDLQNAVLKYAEQYVMPKINAGAVRFGAWFLLGAELARVENIARTQFAGTFVDGDNIDWDAVKKYATLAFEKEGKLPIANILFDKNDFVQFCKIVEGK